MNYIKIINQFWTSIESELYQTSDIALYFYLLKVSNDASWCNPFKRNNRRIEADLSISYKTLCNSRNKLKQNGLIDFATRNGSPNVLYTLSFKDEVRDEVGDEVRDEVGARLVTSKDKLKLNLNPPIVPPWELSWVMDQPIEKLIPLDSDISQKISAGQLIPLPYLLVHMRNRGAPYADSVAKLFFKQVKPSDVWGWLSKFTQELTLKDELYKTLKDYQNHFINWLKIELNKPSTNHYGNNEPDQYYFDG